MASIPWTPQLIELTKVLSDLFREESTARNVTEEAGVPTALIDWREPSYMRWQSIVEEARRREMIPQLIKVAKKWYEESLTLQEAISNWQDTLAKPAPKTPVNEEESSETAFAVIAALRMTVADQESRIRILEETLRDDTVQQELTAVVGKEVSEQWTTIGVPFLRSDTYEFGVCVRIRSQG